MAGKTGTCNVSRSASGATGSGDRPQNTPELAQTRSRSEAARMVPPQNAVALTWSANAAMHGRIEEYSTADAATRWRLRFGASIERVAPFQSLSLTARGTSRDNRRYQRLRPAIREHDPFPTCSWRVIGNRTKALTGLTGPSNAKRWANVQRVIKSTNPINP